MHRYLKIACLTIITAVVLSGCGGGGGGTPAAQAPATVATTKMFLFGTMSSASAGGSAGIIENVETTISALPAGVTLTSIVPSGAAAALPNGDVSSGLNGGNLTISVLNTTNHISLVANTTSNAGYGIEVATLTFSLTDGATPPIPTPGADTTVFQYRTGPLSIKELSGCVVNFTTTYR